MGRKPATRPFSHRELQFCREVASMWFLVRIVFWLGLIIALLPIAPFRQETSASKVGAVDSLSAASAAVSDIRQFCVRQPDACAAGSEAIAQFVHKAETGAQLLYQFLNERKAKDSSTLTPADLAVPWRGSATVR
jgi:Family of unknown function (DUF5330)